MEILDTLVEFIANKTWALILVLVLWLVYEVFARRIPTTSPYVSIVHILGKIFKYLGKRVVKLIGENIAKETDKNKSEIEEVVSEDKKVKKKLFKL
jgi:high-affinity Fe2+/Pb2+ permease